MTPLVQTWPGGEHAFRLSLAELEGIQQNTDAGPEWLLLRLQSGQWTASEVFEVLFFGLIGAGTDNAAARRLVANAFDLHPLVAFKTPATAVLLAALYGPGDDPVGEGSAAAEMTRRNSREESGVSAASMVSEQ